MFPPAAGVSAIFLSFNLTTETMKIGMSHLWTIAAAVCLISPASAAEPDDDVIYEAGTIEIVRSSAPGLADILNQARPVDPNTVQAPKFAIRTADNKFVMSIGGEINPILGYDLGNDLYNVSGAASNFIVGDIPVPAQAGHKSAFFVNPLNSYVDFTIVGLGGTENQVSAYVKLGMNGVSHAALIKRAYVKWRGLTAGETETLFKDGLAAQPPTIDPQGPAGDVSGTAYQVSYVSPSFSGFSFAAALEMPTFYSSNGYYRGHDYRHDYYGVKVTGDAAQVAPDVPVWIQYQASEQNRVRLSAMMRNFTYRDIVSDCTRHMMGWGAMLSGNFSFWKPLTFNFQAVYGNGIANYIQDISGRRLSFTPDDNRPGRMTANPMMGLVFGASFDATPRLQFNAVGSYARIWDVGDYATVDDADGIAGSDNYRYGVYAAANCFYRINSYLQCGIEYVYGYHRTWNLGGASDSRVQTQISFTF